MTQITIPKLELSEAKSNGGASPDSHATTTTASPQPYLTSTAQSQARTFASTHTCPGCAHNFSVTAALTIHAPYAEAHSQPRILTGLEVDQNNGNVKISLEIGEQRPVAAVQPQVHVQGQGQGHGVGEYVALYDFKGEREHELSLVEGEGVVVIQKGENGWTLVNNRRRKSGWVPTTYLKENKKDWRSDAPERKPFALLPFSEYSKVVDDDDEW